MDGRSGLCGPVKPCSCHQNCCAQFCQRRHQPSTDALSWVEIKADKQEEKEDINSHTNNQIQDHGYYKHKLMGKYINIVSFSNVIKKVKCYIVSFWAHGCGAFVSPPVNSKAIWPAKSSVYNRHGM